MKSVIPYPDVMAHLFAHRRFILAAMPAIGLAGLFAAACLLFATMAVAPAMAQQLEERRQATERELSEIREAIELSEQKRSELSNEIDALEKDRASINRNLIAASARQREIERRIDRATTRLESLRSEQDSVRDSLRGRRALLSEVLAALQRMSAKPPPAILVEPEDALTAVRSAILLGAVIPEIRAETEVLIAELSELVRIGDEIDSQRGVLASELESLAEEEERLNLLLAEKRELTNTARQQMADQRARAAELAAKATNLGKLIDTLEAEITASRQAAEAARKSEEQDRQSASADDGNDRAADEARRDFSDMTRITPAMEFAKARGLLPPPADGVLVRAYGEKGEYGDVAEGISIATRLNARVTSPTDGWVVYAGPFRSYGQLLILNAGTGYHVVLAGMETIDVQLGQFVLAGEPVARMGSRRIASVEAVGLESTRPVLYVEFRKDDKSVDPSPWWSDASLKRVADDS